MIVVGYHRRSQKLIAALMSYLLLLSTFFNFPIVDKAEARSMAPSSYNAGTSPYSVAIGDLNDDDLNDVAVANFQAGTVGVYYQQPGGGALQPMVLLDNPPSQYNYGAFSPNPYGIKITDFDGDGRNDLIVTNEFQHQAWIYRQDIAGLYLYQLAATPPIETHPYSNPYSADAGDLSSDGLAEIAVANYYWLDAGNSDFGSVGLFNNWPAAATDLYSASFVNGTTGWISGDHTIFNTLTGGVNPLTGTGLWNAQYLPLDDSSAEVNTKFFGIDFVDEDFGIAVGSKGLILRTLNGGFVWGKTIGSPIESDLFGVAMSGSAMGTAVGDNGLAIRTRDGGITWTDESTEAVNADFNGVDSAGCTLLVGDYGTIGHFHDYDPDTEMDLLDSGTTNNLNAVKIVGNQAWVVGDGGLILNADLGSSPVTWSVQNIGGSNLRGVDFVNSSTGWAVGESGTILKTTNGGASWNPQVSPTPAALNDVSFVDASNGWAVGNGGAILFTFDGGANWLSEEFSGSRLFSSMFNYPLPPTAANPYVAKIGDINNDGKNDITIAAAASGSITNYRMGIGGSGAVLFLHDKQTVAVGALPADMVLLDYNNDGRTDVATSNYMDNTASILTQPILPTNGFELAATLATGQRPLGIETGDINGDGLQDLVVANSDSNSISVFTKQSPTGPFNQAAVFNTSGSGPYGLAIGDVNNDGKEEIVVALSSPNGGNKIDVFAPTVTPGAPTVTSSTHPDSSVYYNSNKPQFQISPPPDIDGVNGYYWKIDTNSNTVPLTTDNFSASGSVSVLNGLADGSYYFHAVARDKWGNVGNTVANTAHYLFRINSTPLIVSIQSPADGTTVSGTVNVETTVTTSPFFSIDKVEVYIDGNTAPAAVLTGAPYQYLWDTTALTNGNHTVKVVAYDSGNRQASDINTVNVDNSALGASDITRSSIILTGDQFASSIGNVSGLTYFESGNDTWNKVGYFAPGATESSAIYRFDLPAPSGYLWQKLTISEDTTVAAGAAAKFYAYNWATGAWDSIPASGDLPFWYIKPLDNEVQVKVAAPAWSVHQIKNLTLEYKYRSDAASPQITSLNGSPVNFANPYFSRLSFGLSEKAFLTINIYDGGMLSVKQIKTAKQEGIPAIYWDLTDNFGNPLPPGDYYFQVVATDIAGNGTTSGLGLINYRSTSTSPETALPWMNWDWNRIKPVSGDFNGDSKTDMAVLYDLGSNQVALYQLTSTGGSFTVQTVWDSGPGNWNWNATNLVSGDFNGDNRDDIAALYGYSGSQTRGFVFVSNGLTLNSPTIWWDSGPGNWDMAGTKPTAGDFNDDDRDDLGVLYGYSGSQTRAFVATSTGAGFSTPVAWWDSGPGNWDWVGSKLTAGDFNGDDRSDIGVLYGYVGSRTTMWIFKSNGSGFNPPGAWWDSGPGNWDWGGSEIVAGDYNSDGLGDYVIYYGYSGLLTSAFGFISNGNGFGQPIGVWSSGLGNWDWSQSKFTGGDYNGDGTDDLSAFYNYGSATGLWVFDM